MSARGKLRILEDGKYSFFCPGCKCNHWFDDTWSFDGNFDSPTVTPSILVIGWSWIADCTVHCHLYLRAGRIEFLSDSVHELAGKSVAMESES